MRTYLLAGLIVAAALSLQACNDTAAVKSGDSLAVVDSTASEPQGVEGTGVDAGDTDQGAAAGASDKVTLAGTGRYTVGADAPYGSYELQGEPDAQPAGCTWSIEDPSGDVLAADQGTFVFLTDVQEAAFFVTSGCPAWEQFE